MPALAPVIVVFRLDENGNRPDGQRDQRAPESGDGVVQMHDIGGMRCQEPPQTADGADVERTLRGEDIDLAPVMVHGMIALRVETGNAGARLAFP